MPRHCRTMNILYSISGSINIHVKSEIIFHFHLKDDLYIFMFVYICISTEFVLSLKYVYYAMKIFK